MEQVGNKELYQIEWLHDICARQLPLQLDYERQLPRGYHLNLKVSINLINKAHK